MMQTCFRFKNPMLLMALAAAYPVVGYGAAAARIDFAAGPVIAVSTTGVQRPLTKGAEISSGDTVRTGNDGRAQLRFSDGAMVSLQPQTEFKIDDYYYSGQNDGKEKSFFNLVKGGLRTITGWIGKSNRDAYRVTTQVATIGIRGTEFLVAYGADPSTLSVTTGEGLVEVCNAAGCALVSAGDTVFVAGSTTTPRRTESQTRLPPAQPIEPELPLYSAGENRSASGIIAPVSAPLVSGNGYYVSHVGNVGGSPGFPATATSVSTTFDAASVLTGFTDNVGPMSYTASSVAGGFTMDGVIGWGAWTTGTRVYGSSTPLADYHYVAGIPTPTADIAALNMTATYQLAGFTTPTTSTGLTGGAPSGVLTASFSGGTASVGLNLSVPVAGTTYSETFSTTTTTANFSMFSACSSVNGFFAGSNASHAGLTYRMDTIGPAGTITGAAVFKR